MGRRKLATRPDPTRPDPARLDPATRFSEEIFSSLCNKYARSMHQMHKKVPQMHNKHVFIRKTESSPTMSFFSLIFRFQKAHKSTFKGMQGSVGAAPPASQGSGGAAPGLRERSGGGAAPPKNQKASILKNSLMLMICYCNLIKFPFFAAPAGPPARGIVF